MYARQRTALRCYLRRLLGCFRHSGRSQRPEYRRAFRKTLRLHAVLRIALIHTRQRTALRCYLRRLAPLVRPPPQPPKIDFVDNSRASAKCSSENRAGRSLDARRPAVVRECSHVSPRRLLPEFLKKYTLPFGRAKGNANRRQAEGNHACMNCRGAKEENKRSAVKSRRGETISGSVSRLR